MSRSHTSWCELWSTFLVHGAELNVSGTLLLEIIRNMNGERKTFTPDCHIYIYIVATRYGHAPLWDESRGEYTGAGRQPATERRQPGSAIKETTDTCATRDERIRGAPPTPEEGKSDGRGARDGREDPRS